MLSLARQMLRAHRAGFIAAFVAVFCGSALITACGVLLESAQRGGVEPERYASAPIVVSASQQLSTPQDLDRRFTERAQVPRSGVATIADVPGVRTVIGDVTVRGGLRTKAATLPLDVHGWDSARLGPVILTDGRAPRERDEAVLTADLGAQVGDTVQLEVGGVAAAYRVVGVTGSQQNQAFLRAEQARALSRDPGGVDAVVVFAEQGIATDELAARIGEAAPGSVIATGDDRAEAEFVDAGATRSLLTLIAGSFGGTMVLIVLLVVASTLGLSVQQRRREFALLRAIAATPRQIYRLICAEAALLSCVAALLGALPGVGLSLWLRDVLVDLDVIPPEFQFTIGPLPVVAAVLCCVASACVAGLIAARRANRISPIEALGAAVVESSRLGRIRVSTGWVLIGAGVIAGIVVPLTIAGPAAAGSAAGSTLLLVIGLALIGPRLLTGTAKVFTRLGMRRTAAGWLANANTGANARRLGVATATLVMGIALAAVQIFTLTTTDGAAARQAEAGLVASHVLVADHGIAPEVVDAVRRVPDVTATPVSQTQVLVKYDEFGDPVTETYAAQGITPSRLDSTMDLDVQSGDLGGLTDGGVALSEFAADTFGVSVGSDLTMRLGDGTKYEAQVVAIYTRGLGFGDVTLPNDVVRATTTNGLNDYILVSGGDPDAVRTAIAPYREVTLTDRDSFAAARADDHAGESTVNLLLNLALLAFIAIAVVNVLVLATAARVREFALLRLVGAKPRQVRAMMRAEAALIIATAVVVGSLAAVPPLLGVSLALTGSALPTIPPLAYLAILATAAVLGWCSIALPTRHALRTAPVTAMGVGE